MKHLKLSVFLIVFLTSINIKAQETLVLPFFDSFEETIVNDAIFTKWTSENVAGWNYWHIIPWNGNPGQCMRFQNCDTDQNDWLISKAINCNGAENLKVNFSHLYHANKVPPKLYYTSQYNGNASQSVWTELSFAFGANADQWYASEDFIIENPGDVIYFAFHYQAKANEGAYFLLDNFSVKSYTPSVPFVLVGSSEHFEFFTNIDEQQNFYNSFVYDLEISYNKYKSIWERPSSNTIFPEVNKIKIIFGLRAEIPDLESISPDWDCGAFDFNSGEIYISPLDNNEKVEYYGTLGKLTCNELAQMALRGWMDFDLAHWFSEGFGLNEMGYRPNRQHLLEKLSELGTEEPPISTLENIDNLPMTGNKDLMASFFLSKDIVHCYFYGYWGDDGYKWWQLLKHYYIKNIDRIELLYSTEHFDFYGATKEIPYIEPMADNMEKQLALQESRFGQLMKHRVNICIYDNEVGKEINNRTDFQGLACGADKINTLPLHDADHYGLINHEFMHVWVNMMSPIISASNGVPLPGQFINEGLAESTDRFMTDEEMPYHNYKIQGLYYHYQRKYNREPTWLEIVDNAEVNKEDGLWVDAYALGEMYWRYMNDKYPENFWGKVKLFLQRGRDWTVFGEKSSDQEGGEFIQFMKELAFVGPPLTSAPIPFSEKFQNSFNGWTLMRYGADDLWRIQDNTGYDDQFCAFAVDPYWLEEKDVDSWLVSPPLNTINSPDLEVSFMYKQYGNGIKPEIFYSENFSGPTHTTNWIQIDNIQWNATEGNWSNMKFSITDPPDKLFIAYRFQSVEGNYASYCLDNLTVKTASSFEKPTIITGNPTSVNQTIAMMNGEVTTDGGTAVTQRGFYWSSTNISPNSGDHIEIVSGTTGSFNKTLENLAPETTYYYRAFATNSEGTATGEVKQFKTLANNPEYAELPFYDDFSNDYASWTTYSVIGNDQWHISNDDGIDFGKCARFYVTSNPPQANDDWLVSQIFNTKDVSNLAITFKYLYNVDGPSPEFYYSTSFDGDPTNTDWVHIDKSFWINSSGWQDARIEIENPGETFVFAVRYQVTETDPYYYFLMDDISVEEITTGIKLTAVSQNNLRVFPNPKTDKSIVSFTNNIVGNVTLAIYDLNGRKLFTLVDEKLLPGLFTYPIDINQINPGLYLVSLSTSLNKSFVKLIVTD